MAGAQAVLETLVLMVQDQGQIADFLGFLLEAINEMDSNAVTKSTVEEGLEVRTAAMHMVKDTFKVCATYS